MSDSDFYSKFEERNRGSRELILSRLDAYSPFINCILEQFDNGKALDIGCGRGEWLELLSGKGIQAKGIDTNQGMLNACLERGLDVLKTDGLNYLEEQQENSLHIISAFHVVEHISFDNLQKLINDAFLALAPGGLLILETPNPENIAVATRNFYLDPTHLKPIPPALLSFLSEYAGFEYNKIVRLQEAPELANKQHTSIAELINGVSPDYAVVAQKPSAQELVPGFKTAFEKEYGLSIDQVSYQFDKRLNSIETKMQETEARSIELERVLHGILQSYSWRLTKPVRYLSTKLKKSNETFQENLTLLKEVNLKEVIIRRLVSIKLYLSKYPAFKNLILKIFSIHPKFQQRLKNISVEIPPVPKEYRQLSPRGRLIYKQLKNPNKKQEIS